MRWESQPGPAPRLLAAWPEGSQIPHEKGRKLVVMFAHPKCSCTKGASKIFERAAKANPAAQWLVVAWRPKGTDWKPETSLPVWVDEGGKETSRFGVTTSGQTVAFSEDGAVLFSGGLTDERSSLAAGKGVRVLEAALAGDAARVRQFETAVFGCSF